LQAATIAWQTRHHSADTAQLWHDTLLQAELNCLSNSNAGTLTKALLNSVYTSMQNAYKNYENVSKQHAQVACGTKTARAGASYMAARITTGVDYAKEPSGSLVSAQACAWQSRATSGAAVAAGGQTTCKGQQPKLINQKWCCCPVIWLCHLGTYTQACTSSLSPGQAYASMHRTCTWERCCMKWHAPVCSRHASPGNPPATRCCMITRQQTAAISGAD
jgi:hypothetical protein